MTDPLLDWLDPELHGGLNQAVAEGRASNLRDALNAAARAYLSRNGEAASVEALRSALRENEQRLRTLADHLPNGMVYQVAAEVDGTRRFLFVSAGVERLLGVSVEAVLRDAGSLYGLILEDHREPLVAAEERALRTRSSFNVEAPMQIAGETRWFQISSAPREQADGSTVWDGIVLEISALKRAQDALRNVNDELRRRVIERTAQLRASETSALNLYNRSPVPQHSIDAQGRYLAVSDGWLEMMGYQREEVIGRRFYDFLPPQWEEHIRNGMVLLKQLGELRDFEYELVAKDGSLRPISVTTRVEYDEEGNWVRTYGVTMDLRERKAAEAALAREAEERRRAEEALQQAQKMQALGQLTGGIAHDFNNLLTIIRGGADMLGRPNLSPERQKRFISGIIEATERASSLTNQLLAFARKQPLRPEVIDLPDRIERMAEVLRRTLGARYRIQTKLDPDTWTIEADPTQLEIALLNIGVNARDAMPEGGVLTIRTLNETLPARGSRPAGEFVCLSIRDTGCGIPSEHLPHVFEPFYTTKDVGKGTGLGLSQVYGFVSQSGGDVRIESTPGEGSAVFLTLPRAQAGAVAKQAETPVADDGQHRGRVLLVEDNAEVGTFAQSLLEELGYDVVRVDNGAEAVTRLGTDQHIDLVFSDIVMPGMTGLELARKIQRSHPKMPIVLTTGYSEHQGPKDLLGIPVLPKPYRLDTLSAALRGALATGAASTSP